MANFEIEIPEFLTKKHLGKRMFELSRVIRDYDEHFRGRDCLCLEGLIITEENKKDYIATIKTCLKEDRTFNDVWGTGELDEGDFI